MRSRYALLLILLLTVTGRAADYQMALPGYHYDFPRDYFSHPNYQTEWWYYTGNVRSADGHRFGFELTFFRQGVSRESSASPWYVHDLYMAHLALSDLSGGHYYHAERINRSGPGIAGIEASTGLIWNGNWRLHIDEQGQQISAVAKDFALTFSLTPQGPVVIQGQNGISRKAAGAGHASHYFSLPRLLTSGAIEVEGTTYQVQGTTWMDHEFFTGSMAGDESGWDWIGIQFSNNSELMLYRMRHKDGTVDPFSSGSYVDAQGKSRFLSARDFTMTPEGDIWTSSVTHGEYPLRWQVSIPSLGIRFEISTPLRDQELTSAFGPSYWEGAINTRGEEDGQALEGVGYLEMTGYARSTGNSRLP